MTDLLAALHRHRARTRQKRVSRLVEITNDLRAARACIDEAEALQATGRVQSALLVAVMALRPLLRLVAEVHGFDEFGNPLSEARRP